MSRIQTSSLLVLSTFALALSALPVPAHSAPVAKAETSRIVSGDYAQRREAVGEQVRPKEGYRAKLVLGDVVVRMVSHGVIDMTKMMEALYKERGGIPPELKQVLTQPTTTPLVVTGENANWLVNILWPIGLSNKMAINKRSPIVGKDIGNLASTAGWQLGKAKNGASYFNRYKLVPLTREQQQRVWRIATSTYRPCCDNSTFFQDCNHGSAALAVIQLAGIVRRGDLPDAACVQFVLVRPKLSRDGVVLQRRQGKELERHRSKSPSVEALFDSERVAQERPPPCQQSPWSSPQSGR